MKQRPGNKLGVADTFRSVTRHDAGGRRSGGEAGMLDISTRRNRGRDRLAAAAQGYAALGWPCFPGAYAPEQGTRACSCDRIGCPAPGAHPVSAVWQRQASVDADVLARLWGAHPEANIILPTGRVFDVVDVPAQAGHFGLG